MMSWYLDAILHGALIRVHCQNSVVLQAYSYHSEQSSIQRRP